MLALLVAFTTATVIVARTAAYTIFSYYAPWDDEGYVLVSLKLFRQGRALYDAVYSQYGPFYFEVMDLLLSVIRQNLTHDVGRVITTGVWVATTLLCGLSIFALTRSLWVGCAVQLLTALALDTMRYEPMHPGGLICLALGFIAVTMLLIPPRPRLAWMLLGAAGAGLLLTKINVGIFTLLAVGFVALGGEARTRVARVLLASAGVAILCVPPLLMRSYLAQPLIARYAIHVMAAILPLVVLENVRPSATFMRGGGLLLASGAAAGTALAISAIVIYRGTTVDALLHAVLIAPLHHANVILIPVQLPPHSRKFALLAALAGVAAVVFKREPRPWGAELAGAFRVAAGLAICVTVANVYPSRLGFLLAPLAWMAALPVSGIPDPPALAFARRFLPMLAVLQTLHAFPVAGSQVQWGAFLLVTVGAICIVDGARQLGRSIITVEKLPMVATAAAMLFLLFTVWPTLKQLEWWRHEYRQNEPLQLPGSRYMRLPAAQVTDLRAVVQMMRDHGCSTYFSAPGHGSYYFWMQREPPTGFQATLWNGLLGDVEQRRAIRDLERASGVCILQGENIIAAWANDKTYGTCALCEYIDRHYVTVWRQGPYELMKRLPERKP